MKKKNVILLISIPLGMYLFWIGYAWKLFSCSIAGSSPCVETWTLKLEEKELIELIFTLEKERPELFPPNSQFPIYSKDSYWHYFTFYYEDTNENIQTWIRGNDNSAYTTLALKAISNHTDRNSSTEEQIEAHESIKEINRDFNYFDNSREIKKFEKTIIETLKKEIRNR